jgi:hypothetical protein
MTPRLQSSARTLARAFRQGTELGGDLVASHGWVHAVARRAPGDDRPAMTVHLLGRKRHLAQALASFFPHQAPAVETRFEGSLPGLLARRGEAMIEAAGAEVRLVDLVPGLATGSYLRARLTLDGSVDAWLDAVRSRQLRARLRRLHREALAVTVTREPADLDRFYRELYVPQAVCRFGARAHLDPEEGLMRLVARRGALLLVERRGRLAGGALVYSPRTEASVLMWAKLGLAHADTLSASDRGEATAALELAVVGHALATGHTGIDLGLCSASLEDGVLIHKLRLGADLSPAPGSPRLALALAPAAAPEVARVAPFVAVRDGRLVAVVGYGPAGAPPEPAHFAAWLRDRLFPGLDAVEVRVAAGLGSDGLAAAIGEHLGAGAPSVRVVLGPEA